MVSEKDVLGVLKTVLDPEIAFNIVDLGLVYGVSIEGKNVSIKMTMTTPLCPMAPEIIEEVKSKVGKMPGVEKVDVEIVWEPAWTPEKMSEQARIELGLV
ncbi:MAG: metal-sulfur cluster assembly factor [Candidatus Norongarragalinales archaeon]